MTLILPCGPRLIVLSDQVTTLRGRLVTPQIPTWPMQAPAEIVVLAADFGFLTNGASVVSAAVDRDDLALSIAQAAPIGTAVAFAAFGGTPSGSATVQVTANFADGQVRVRDILLPIGPASTITPSTPIAQTVITTDATPTVIASARALSGLVMRLTGKVLAVSTAGAVASWDVSALLVGLGTTPTLSGTGAPSIFRIDDVMVGCSFEPVPVAGGFNLVATGLIGTMISWSTTFEMEIA
jgi:hypothetical protein